MTTKAENASPVVETDRELAHRLRAEEATAEREVREAREDYNRKRSIRLELERTGRLLSDHEASVRTLRSARKRGERLIEEELEAARGDAADACLEAARQLRAATGRLLRARVARVRYELPSLLAEHEAVAERVHEADKRTQKAYVALVVALIERAEARSAEAVRARAVAKVVGETLTSDDDRALLRHRAANEIPTGLDEDGEIRDWKERPVDGLWGLGGTSWQPANRGFYESLGEIAAGGRERVGGTCGSAKVAGLIQRALARN